MSNFTAWNAPLMRASAACKVDLHASLDWCRSVGSVLLLSASIVKTKNLISNQSTLVRLECRSEDGCAGSALRESRRRETVTCSGFLRWS
jgi:hypothetical protein